MVYALSQEIRIKSRIPYEPYLLFLLSINDLPNDYVKMVSHAHKVEVCSAFSTMSGNGRLIGTSLLIPSHVNISISGIFLFSNYVLIRQSLVIPHISQTVLKVWASYR